MTSTFSCYVAGKPVTSGAELTVRCPYDGRIAGTVQLAGPEHVEAAITAALTPATPLTRFERAEVLEKARALLESRREACAQLITTESGLCIRDTRYEVGRALDVLRLAALEALRDDGEVFSCDISPQGKARKIFTLRE